MQKKAYIKQRQMTFQMHSNEIISTQGVKPYPPPQAVSTNRNATAQDKD